MPDISKPSTPFNIHEYVASFFLHDGMLDYFVDGDNLERAYKYHLSGYPEWDQIDHADKEPSQLRWRARKYVVLCHESLQKHKDTHEAAARGCLPQYSSAPGIGKKVRVFERYFVDVNDQVLDYFIRFTQPISPRAKWLGSRAEAVIFAEEFGLTDSEPAIPEDRGHTASCWNSINYHFEVWTNPKDFESWQ